MKIIIAQCTSEKRNGQHLAKELYMPSDLFQAQRRYAEAYADRWYIMSGKYGLADPWDRISDYDMHISEGWQGERLDIIQNTIQSTVRHWPQDATVELICGHEDYARRFIPFLESYNIAYTEPFRGMGIGERTKAMIEQARKVENQSLTSYAER